MTRPPAVRTPGHHRRPAESARLAAAIAAILLLAGNPAAMIHLVTGAHTEQIENGRLVDIDVPAAYAHVHCTVLVTHFANLPATSATTHHCAADEVVRSAGFQPDAPAAVASAPALPEPAARPEVAPPAPLSPLSVAPKHSPPASA
jgi:hypothetical protein